MVDILHKGTYWYKNLYEKGKFSQIVFAIYRLLSGRDDLKDSHQMGLLKPSKVGVAKFMSIITTIDGMLLQIVTAFPEVPEFNSWEFTDRIIRSMFSNLIVEYALVKRSSSSSYYEDLKRLRKQIKFHGFSESLSYDKIEVPRRISFFNSILSRLSAGKRNSLNDVRVGILCQTRCVGSPPPHMYAKSLGKFLETIQGEVFDPPYKKSIWTASVMVYRKIREIIPRFEQYLPTAMAKMKVSLSDSAEFDVPQSLGGKYEAARRLISSIGDVTKMDLFNGSNTGQVIERKPENFGEIIFHHALRTFKDMDDKGGFNPLMDVRVSQVSEPGKVRVVTVSHLLHAVILHPLAHLLNELLGNDPQSASGMKAANHAWNFFVRLSHKNPTAGFIFQDDKRPKPVYALSSDLEEATDHGNPIITQTMLVGFCGPKGLNVPRWYLNVCIHLLTEPRQITYREIGSSEMKTITSTRGIFMGDPMCKFVMHLHHLVSTELTQQIMLKHGS